MTLAAETPDERTWRLLLENDRQRVVIEVCERHIAELESELLDARATRQPASDAAVEARLSRALSSLESLTKQLTRIQGYSTAQEQAELREARAVLVEEGR
jgi:hypothetical protein